MLVPLFQRPRCQGSSNPVPILPYRKLGSTASRRKSHSSGSYHNLICDQQLIDCPHPRIRRTHMFSPRFHKERIGQGGKVFPNHESGSATAAMVVDVRWVLGCKV